MEATEVIDVSHHQGTIDWEQVKNAGIAGVIIRCGYGTDRPDQDDREWKTNADACTRLGIPFGAYLYSYADSNEKAESEAAHAIRLLSGYRLSYPVYYDVEKAGTEAGASERARVFCEKIRDAGYFPGVYANKNWWDNYLRDLTEYTRWVARYHDSLEMKDVDLWQYTSKGSVAGISGNVDLNRCYRNFPAEIGAGTAEGPAPDLMPERERIAVDGKWGEATTRRLQQIFKTAADGKVSHQFAAYRAENPGLDYGSFQWERDPSGYSPLMKAFQGYLNSQNSAGLTVDGHIGPKTIRAIQIWVGSGADGHFDKVSPAIRKLQEWINLQ